MKQNTILHKVALALPLVGLPAFIAVGSFLSLKAPAPVLPAYSTEKPVTDAPKTAKRMYMPLRSSVRVSLPDSGRVIKIGLGLALDEDIPSELYDEILHTPERLQAGLAGTVQTLRDNLGPTASLEELRRALPPILTTEMNKRLQELGYEPQIQEVLIIEWAVGG